MTSSGGVEVRLEVKPRWCFRLPRRAGLDGLTRIHGGVVHRLLHAGERPVLVRVVQTAPDRVLFGARAPDRGAAAWGIERMRKALGIDQDLRPFYERFHKDQLIGAALRADPGLRVFGRPEPFEALVWAICEQLIDYERAAGIQRRLIFRLGRSCSESGMRDSPTAEKIAAQAPARLEAFDLSAARALALVKAARDVAAGRIDLDHHDHEVGWRRLRAIPGIGSWTVQTLALGGQGRLDQLPAGDLAYLKLVGRLRSGNPRGRASGEREVADFFAPYAPWAGLAGIYALRSADRIVPNTDTLRRDGHGDSARDRARPGLRPALRADLKVNLG
ncbi:MAG: DNA-3-methyladenine glycosylase family protein [Solirubrobacteraceae bacterium]